MNPPSVCRLVTFLGTGKYKETIYQLDGEPAPPTPYVCRALAELFDSTEITVLATEEAEKQHKEGLKQSLRDGNRPSPCFIRIPLGRDSAERWEQFKLLKEQLRGCGGPVMLDVTHGFRSQPLFAASIVAFVRAVDETPPDLRICYAAFEAKQDNLTPIWELSEVLKLLDWAQALRMFLRSGRAQEAAAETTRLGSELAKAWVRGGRCGDRPSLDTLGKGLKEFGEDLETLRTGDLLIRRGTKKSSAERLLSSARQAKEGARTHAPPLADVLDRVIEMAEPLAGERHDLSGDEGRRAVAALAALYLGLGRYLEAAATVREGWVNLYAPKTALCPGGENFDRNERDRAEKRAHEHDKAFREVTDRRNDFLHAQYRPRFSTQGAAGAISTAKGLVQKLQEVQRPQVAACTARGSCFVNLSNHARQRWEEEQSAAALTLAERIEDLPFPSVPPDADEAAIDQLAEDCLSKVPPEATHALVQGEFTLTVALVRRLQARGVTCLAATSVRQVEDAGDGRRTSTFRFVRFRGYPPL